MKELYSRTDSKRIWVADFSRSTTDADLLQLFQRYGKVASVKIRNKKILMAFVNMTSSLDGKQAIINLNGSYFMGSIITVKESNQIIEREQFIYALLDFDKEECYIGQTCDPKESMSLYKRPYL